MPEATASRLAAGRSPSSRRALARADAGKALDVDEATALLAARGRGSRPPHRRSRRACATSASGDVVTYSRKVFIPLTHALPRHLPLLHVREAARQARGPRSCPRSRSSAIATAGRRAGCKEALFTLGDKPEDRYPAARRWLERAATARTLEYLRAVAIQVIEETGLLPHLNPGVMSWRSWRGSSTCSASMGLMLETAVGPPVAKGGAALRLPRQGARGAAAHDRGRGPPRDPLHHRDPGRDRRDRPRARRVAVRDPRPPPALPPPPGGDRAELPRQARHRDARRARARRRGVPGRGRDRARGPRPAHAPAGATEPHATRRQRLRLLDAGIDDWGGVSPVTPDHVNPEKPWPQIDALPRPRPPAASACASA